jgi:DNA-binding transcriptional MerR regulator
MKIGELARRTGVSCDVLRAWERRYGVLRPRRSAGGHRLYSTLDEQRVLVMRRHLAAGRPTAQAAELTAGMRLGVVPGEAAHVGPDEVAASHADLRRAIDAFDETGAQRVIERLLAAHAAIAVVRDVMVPSQLQLGEQPVDTPLRGAQARFAAAFFAARMHALARGWDRGTGPRALLACPPGEHRGFTLSAFGIALHHCGWRIVSLGADTPVEVVAAAAQRLAPDLIVLTATHASCFAPEPALRRLATSWPCAIGGPGASGDVAARCGARFLGDDPVAAAFALQRLQQ